MNNGPLRQAYEILNQIYRENTFTNLLMKDNEAPRVSKLVYGVLEKHFSLNFVIDSLTEKKKTKPVIRTLLLLGAYQIIYLHTPTNVVINETNDLADELGKDALKPFMDAIIRKIGEGKYPKEPAKSDKRYFEVKYNLPVWLIGMYRKDYPDNWEEVITAPSYDRTHIRLCRGEDEDTVKKADLTAVKTLTGYFVKNNKEIGLLNYLGQITFISYPSSLVAYSIPLQKGQTVLDACSAPGGKGIYLRERGAEVTMCDIYPHRLKLIQSYCDRVGVKTNIALADATVFRPEWENAFDVVLADAPCSGFGVIAKKRDVVFNKTYEDVLALAELQSKILDNVSRYVKRGGLLCYSTCTVFKKENDENVAKFLLKHSDFTMEKIDLPYENEGKIQFLPDGKGMEGFFVCHLRRR